MFLKPIQRLCLKSVLHMRDAFDPVLHVSPCFWLFSHISVSSESWVNEIQQKSGWNWEISCLNTNSFLCALSDAFKGFNHRRILTECPVLPHMWRSSGYEALLDQNLCWRVNTVQLYSLTITVLTFYSTLYSLCNHINWLYNLVVLKMN